MAALIRHWRLMLSVVSVYVPPVVVSSPYHVTDSPHLAVGPSGLLVRWSGTLFLWPFVIRRHFQTAAENSPFLRSNSACNALKVFTLIRYENLHLLTLLLYSSVDVFDEWCMCVCSVAGAEDVDGDSCKDGP